MAYEIMRLEQEILFNDLIFDKENYYFTFHNHNINVNYVKLYRDYRHNIKIEMELINVGDEQNYVRSWFNKEINFLLKNRYTLECYCISCRINRQINSINSEKDSFTFYGIVDYVNYYNNYSRDINFVQEWYVFNDSGKLKNFNSTDFSINENYLVKHRCGIFYKDTYRDYTFDLKIDMSNFNFSSEDIEALKKQSKSISMNNLLLSFGEWNFFVEKIRDFNEEIFLIIEYNKEFGIPTEYVKNKIHNLLSFLYGSTLIKISEKKYNHKHELFNEKVLSPYIHDIDLTLTKQIKPIEFVFDKGNFLKIFYDMSIIYSDKQFKFLDDVFREYFYISSLEIKSEVILLEALFDMVVKGYCYHILKINQVFDDKKYYSKPKNKRKCIEKFTSTLNITEKNIDQEIKSIRNSITHGDYQIQINDLHKAKFYYRTLINESILKLLGYTGEFMNYYQQYELEKYKERLFECLSAKKYDKYEYEELQEIKYGLIPKLYRYMPANEENIKQYLIDYKIKLSTPNYYDDTRDTSFYVNKNDLEEYVDNIKKSSNGKYKYSINSETCKQISIPTNEIEIKSPLLEKHENKKEIYEQINNVGQKSFTATKNSQYHWDEYAGENGICIEYDFKKLDFNTHIVHNIFPVIYMDESKFDIMKNYAGNWLNLYFISLIKNSGYINDNEWRLIQIIDDLYEYKDEIRLPKPECVYLSKNIDDNIKEYITKLCEERNINIEI